MQTKICIKIENSSFASYVNISWLEGKPDLTIARHASAVLLV